MGTMTERIRGKYRNALRWLCRYEIGRLTDTYPMTRKQLIEYNDFMSIQVFDSDAENKQRILGIALATAFYLENPEVQEMR